MTLSRSSLLCRPYNIDSRVPGPTVVVTAGVHGTEIAGVKAAKALSGTQICRGRLIIYPLINREAHQNRIRGVPDLNRLFPKRPEEVPRNPISRALFDQLKLHQPTWCIDLHEADGLFKVNPRRLGQTVIVYPDKKTFDVASEVVRQINNRIANRREQFSVIQRILPGSLRTATGRILKCNSLTVETCIQMQLKRRVDTQLAIVRMLLQKVEML